MFYEVLDTSVAIYKIHFPEDLKNHQKVWTISRDDISVKVYTLFFNNNFKVDTISTNFRHGNINHVKDLIKLGNIAFHVGQHSIDIYVRD